MPTKTVSYQEVVDVVMTVPVDRLASVYDFARFVRAQALDAAGQRTSLARPKIKSAATPSSGIRSLPPLVNNCG